MRLAHLNEMFSSFGYDALNDIFAIQQENLLETERRRLIRLAMEQESDEHLKEQVSQIKETTEDEQVRARQLLDLVKDH
ncbi:hypothetical protein [Halobacillus sp. Marseille-P3879]|uniref:hypothetical protein n=1 Tax=Halobacillus sp. Marseille-P3879 TaxID=2045014 RepID=UPI000C79D630|nr:hypothetical protein [Halobacillus sp. Marseille-P3879]